MEQKNQTPRRHIFKAMEAKSLRSRSSATRLADYLTTLSSQPSFLFLNIAFFGCWILVNSGLLPFPGFTPFDPFPFGLLTMIMSIEAIMLSIFVLISQNRAAQTATIRDELHLRINLIAEQEITKTLQMLARIEKKMNIKIEDPELDGMIKNLDTTTLEQSIANQIERVDQRPFTRFRKSEFSMLIQSLMEKKS